MFSYPSSEGSFYKEARRQGDLGPMLWLHFSAIFGNFQRKTGVFLKSIVVIKFLHYLALFWVKSAIFLPYFGENIQKIITSVPNEFVKKSLPM
jgi:hypothetical protein